MASRSRQSIAFSRHENIGLHHLVLRVSSNAVLEALHQRFNKLENVEVELSPEAVGDKNIQHITCIIPGGVP